MFASFILSLFSNIIPFLNSSTFLIGYIQNSSLFPEPLSFEEEKHYLYLMKKGDIEARNILIEHNLRLVALLAKKYNNIVKSDLEDLISIGTIGLIKGIDSFDSRKGFKLSTFISRCIENEILMYFRISKKLNAEVSLNDPIGKDKDDNVVTLQEVLENQEKNIEDEIDIKFNIKALYSNINKVLNKREKKIIELRFGLNNQNPMTQIEIAKILGISRSYVSRIESKAVSKLAKEMNMDNAF